MRYHSVLHSETQVLKFFDWFTDTHTHTHTLTIVQPFGLSLQGHPRCIGFYASSASTGTLWTIKRHHDVAQLSSAEGTSMHQLILMDNSPSNTFKETKPYFKMPLR